LKTITCLNGWRKNACCGSDRKDFVHGIVIKNGVSILRTYHYPFTVYTETGKLVITKDGNAEVYYINEFSQSQTEIQNLISACVLGQLGNRLQMRRIEYAITASEDTFEMPIAAGEEFAGSEFVNVFMPTLVNQGNGTTTDAPDFAFEYQVVDDEVVFNELIPAPDPGDDPYSITIIYFVYT
jgi:hypothetical protein